MNDLTPDQIEFRSKKDTLELVLFNFCDALRLIKLISKESDDEKWVYCSDLLRENIADITKRIAEVKGVFRITVPNPKKENLELMNRIRNKTEEIFNIINKLEESHHETLSEYEKIFLNALERAFYILKMPIILK